MSLDLASLLNPISNNNKNNSTSTNKKNNNILDSFNSFNSKLNQSSNISYNKMNQSIPFNNSSQQRVESTLKTSTSNYSSPTVSSFIFREATMEDSLIPRRRRRTSSEELEILEVEFKRNPLPTQFERSKIAEKVNMSGRGVQIWFQNRRQKEKNHTSNYLGSEASSNESAIDPDQDPRDLEPFTFSSSPIVETTSNFASTSLPILKSQPTSPPLTKSINHLVTDSSSPLPASQELYALRTEINNKENTSPISPASAVLLPLLNAMVDQQRSNSISSNEILAFAAKRDSFIRRTSVAQQQQTTTTTTPMTNSLASKKNHISRRPLGGSAPLARKSSLSHNFDFPASPPKKSRNLEDSKNNATTTSKHSLLKRKASMGGLFSSLSANDSGRARVWVDSLTKAGEMENGNLEKEITSTSSTLSLSKNDEMWRHMASDPVSGFSPPNSPPSRPTRDSNIPLDSSTSLLSPLSRKRQFDSRSDFPLNKSNFSAQNTASTSTSSSLSINTSSSLKPRRASLIRSHSLGGISLSQQQQQQHQSSSSSTASSSCLIALENSRAGTVESCAEKALSRKRAKMIPRLDRSRSRSHSNLTTSTKLSSSSSLVDGNRRRSTGTSTSSHLQRSTTVGNYTQSALNPRSTSSVGVAGGKISSSSPTFPTFPSTILSTSTSTPFSALNHSKLVSLVNNLPSSAPSSDNENENMPVEEAEEGDEDEENSSLGELSFTSTTTSGSNQSSTSCTSNSIISSHHLKNTSPRLVLAAAASGKSSLMNKILSGTSSNSDKVFVPVAPLVVRNATGGARLESEEERECAELLLGLGGFGH